MSLTPIPLAQLSADQVSAASSILAQLLLEHAPDADLRRGVLGDLLLQLESAAWASLDDLTQRTLALSTLQGLADDPSADSDMAAAVLSNYRLSAGDGAKATGQIRITVSATLTTYLPEGTPFALAGKLFKTSQEYYVAASNESERTDTVALLPTGTGSYTFTLLIEADAVGSDFNLARGTAALPLVTIAGFVSATASTAMTGGTDTASLPALVQQAQQGLASRGFSNSASIAAFLMQQAGLEDLVAVSAVGQGDAEQRRHHTIFPVAVSGRVDAFVRTQALPELVSFDATATLVSVGPASSLWQVPVGRDEAPGFYEVVSVTKDDDVTITSFDSITPGFDLTGLARTPDVTSTTEAAFSRYSTASVRFVDSRTPTAELVAGVSTQDCVVVLQALPAIAQAQAAIDDPDTGSFGLDVLARAPVPCLVSVGLVLVKLVSEADPDTETIKADLASLVNEEGFGGSVTAASMLSVIGQRLSATQRVQSLELTGRTIYPDGTVSVVNSTEALIAPTDTAQAVSSRTVSFFLDPDDIEISVTS